MVFTGGLYGIQNSPSFDEGEEDEFVECREIPFDEDASTPDRSMLSKYSGTFESSSDWSGGDMVTADSDESSAAPQISYPRKLYGLDKKKNRQTWVSSQFLWVNDKDKDEPVQELMSSSESEELKSTSEEPSETDDEKNFGGDDSSVSTFYSAVGSWLRPRDTTGDILDEADAMSVDTIDKMVQASSFQALETANSRIPGELSFSTQDRQSDDEDNIFSTPSIAPSVYSRVAKQFLSLGVQSTSSDATSLNESRKGATKCHGHRAQDGQSVSSQEDLEKGKVDNKRGLDNRVFNFDSSDDNKDGNDNHNTSPNCKIGFPAALINYTSTSSNDDGIEVYIPKISLNPQKTEPGEPPPMPPASIEQLAQIADRMGASVLSYDSDIQPSILSDECESNDLPSPLAETPSRNKAKEPPKDKANHSSSRHSLMEYTSASVSSDTIESIDSVSKEKHSPLTRHHERKQRQQLRILIIVCSSMLCIVLLVCSIYFAVELQERITSADAKGPPTDLPWLVAQTLPSTNPTSSPSGIRQIRPTPSTLSPSLFSSEVSVPSRNPAVNPTEFPSSALITDSPSKAPTESPSKEPSPLPTENPSRTQDDVSRFYVIGDLPYNLREKERLKLHVSSVPDDAEFVIHVGDIRPADDGNDCLKSEFEEIAGILLKSPVPVFLVPGDNEYNDCPNLDESWDDWMDVFGDFEKNWDSQLQVQRDPIRPENFFFVHKRTLYIGLNIVGGLVDDRDEWDDRLQEEWKLLRDLVETHVMPTPSDADAVVIIAHADPRPAHDEFFVPLEDYIESKIANKVPILYVNGDKHYFQFDDNFRDQPNFQRLMVEGGAKEPPLQLTVTIPSSHNGDLEADEVFVYNRFL